MDLTSENPMFTPINSEQADYMQELIQQVNSDSKFILIDVTKEFKDTLLSSINLNTGFTPFSMLRLLADLLPQLPDKLIYLDTDTLINNDITELYDYDISKYELAGVKDAFRLDREYFNSGVLLFNLKMCKETNLFEKTREIVRTKKMLFVDQTALNIVTKKRLMLPIKFNAKSKYFPEIVVHHFCNVRKNVIHRIKPWEVNLVKEKMNNYDDILDDYLARKAQFKGGVITNLDPYANDKLLKQSPSDKKTQHIKDKIQKETEVYEYESTELTYDFNEMANKKRSKVEEDIAKKKVKLDEELAKQKQSYEQSIAKLNEKLDNVNNNKH
jgi:lipopolysaccharide biosynthesis glycosyltransferase